MTGSQLRAIALAALIVALPAGSVLAHDYSAPFFYMAGVYASDGDRQYPPASDEEMGWLLKLIQDDDKGTRAIAAGALGQTRDKRAVEPLLKALDDKADSVRMNAAVAFVHIQDPRAMEPLSSMLGAGGDGNVDAAYGSMAAAYALAAQGDAGFEALAKVHVEKGAKPTREEAYGYLAQMLYVAKGESAALDWAAAKTKSPDQTMRRTALILLRGLGWTKEKQARLSKLLGDKSLAKVILDIALGSTEGESEMAAQVLAASGDKSLIDALAAAAQDTTRKDRAMLCRILRDADDPYARSRCVPTRGEALDDKAAAGLVREVKNARGSRGEAFDGGVPREPYDAAERLGLSGNKAATKALAGLLSGPNEYVAEAAVYGLSRSNDPSALDALVKAARDPKSKVSMTAATSLIDAKNPRLLPFYVSLLRSKQDRDHSLTPEAIRVLGALGDRKSIQHLVAYVVRSDLQAEDLMALAELKNPEVMGAVISHIRTRKTADPGAREAVVGALAQYGSGGVGQLIPWLKDASPSVRLTAAEVFRKVRDSRAVEPLISALGDKNQGVRESVVWALVAQRDVRGIDATAGMLKDKNVAVRRAAAYAAATLPNPGIADTLVALLKDTDREIRDCAGTALGELGDSRGADAMMRVLKPSESDESRSLDLLPFAIRAGGKLMDRRAIGPILRTLDADISLSTFEHVSEDEHAHSRHAKLDALRAITGRDFGCAYYRWIAYWVAQGNEFSGT